MQNYITYKSVKISFFYKGKGDAIVFLHSFLANSSIWKDFVDNFSKTHKVICVDLPGHGKSDFSNRIHSIEEMAKIVNRILITLKINCVTLVGHSLGGYISLAFSELFPKKIVGLCLLNSSSQADSKERLKIRKRTIEMAKKSYPTLINLLVENTFSYKDKEKLNLEIKDFKKSALSINPNSYIAITKAISKRKNRQKILENFRGKKILIAGKKDSVLPIQSVLNEAISTKTPLRVLKSGHMSLIENKNKTMLILNEFFNM